MAIWNNFPYSNTHELNLDYIVKTQKEQNDRFVEVIDETTSLRDETQLLKNQTADLEEQTQILRDQSADLEEQTQTLRDQSADFKEQTENIRNEMFSSLNQIETNRQNILVNSQRIDEFTQLAEGSTTADAELIDIRVGANGITYPTAGDAVRGQYTILNNENDNIEKGLLLGDTTDFFRLESDGFAPQPVPCVVSYFEKSASDTDAPFYPDPMGVWHPTTDLSATFRYALLSVPADLANEQISIGIWVKFTEIAPTKSIRLALRSTDNTNLVANFDRYVSTTLVVGATQTVNGCKLTVDAKINEWYHISINVPAGKSVGALCIGSDYFIATDRIYWSMPKIIQQPEIMWFINYPNYYYHPEESIKDIIKNKTIGWFGDSIMLGRHESEDYGWYNNLESLGATITQKAVNGAMIVPLGSGYHSILTETAANVFPSDIDYLIFDGGANDFFNRTPVGTLSDNYSGSYDTTTVVGAFEQVCYNLLTNYPETKLGYIIPYKMQTYADIQVQKTYFDALIEACKKWGVPYLDLRYMTGLNYNIASQQMYFKDSVHINKAGYVFTENIIAEWIRSI